MSLHFFFKESASPFNKADFQLSLALFGHMHSQRPLVICPWNAVI